ncbi:MAG: glycosyltransferase family 2 protein [Nitrospirae bacterium]|nr:MAG: glycosyltransferase family 2 protein [Nitrospirota bacterium]
MKGMDSDNIYKVSVVMPSLNEQANLELAVKNVITAYESLNIKGQIVIVNDGSSDSTGSIAESLAKQYSFVKVLHHETPQGIGGSFWDGALSSDGEAVIMVPGDGENDAAEILRYMDLMEHVDVIVPYVFNKSVRSTKRRILSRLYRGIINVSFGMSLNYMNGTVVYRKAVFENIELRSKGFFYQTELLIKCIRAGYLYAEVPYALKVRAEGVSKAVSLKSLKNVIKAYISTFCSAYFCGGGKGEISPATVTYKRFRALEG